MENWIGSHGAVIGKHEKEFDLLEMELKKIFSPLARRMNHKELHHVAQLAAAGAVGRIVRDWANRRERARQEWARRKKG